MDCKLINRQQLPANRWQQDDTPCFVPFPNQSLKYWITTLLVAMMSIVGAWAETNVTIETTKSLYNADKTFQDHYNEVNVNVTLSGRSFTSNQIDGVCFPFSASANVVKSTLGDGVVIYELTSAEGSTFTFTPKADASVVAGVPYLVKPSQTVSDPVFSGVTLPASGSIDDRFVTHSLSTSDFAFRGYYFLKYQDVLFDSNNAHTFYYLDTDGTFKNASTSGVWKQEGWGGAYAYFYVADKNNLPTIVIQGSGSGGSGDGEGGDTPVDPSTMTLQQKINARLQLTDAPTIYIDLPDQGNTSLDDYLFKIRGNATTAAVAPYRRASIKVVATDDTTSPHYMESFEEDADHLEIKVRGNSTALQGVSDAKRAYRLKFAKKDKTTGQNFKHDMINGGYSKRNWTLLANAFDHSLIRNALTCELGKIVGMPFNPGYKFVDLVINNEYRGTYQVSDHCEADADRININEDTGWYLEFQGNSGMLDYPMCLELAGPTMLNVNNPEPEDETVEEQRNAILNVVEDWITNKWKKGFGKGFTNPESGWRAYNDEETLLKFWIITEITGDYDGMMSVKAYREADGKLCWGPIWDKDLAYGNFHTMKEPNEKLVSNLDANGSSVRYYFTDIFGKDPEFTSKLKAKMDELVSNGIVSTLCSKIDQLSTLVKNTNVHNSERWGYTQRSMEEYHGGVSGYDNLDKYKQQLKDWITNRVAFVQEEFDKLAVAANTIVGDVVYDVAKTQSENAEGTDALYKESNSDKLLNITLKNRSFAANEWSSISLPFSVDAEQMKTIFGTTYDIKTFTGVTDDGTKMIFETPEDKSIKAGMPYIIKPSQAVADNTVFNKVIFSCYPDWIGTVNPNGESITFGNYTLTSSIYNAYLPNKNLIGNDGKTLTATDGSSYNGSIVYVTVADGAAAPTIQFGRTVRTQLTNLPTIYIDTKDGAEIQPSTGDYVQAAIQVIDDPTTGHLTSFTESEEYLQVRGRGKAEWSDADGKKSYRLKFAKKHKYDLTGAGYTKRNWILAANAADESMIKNALTSALGQYVGMPFTPNVMFVDLVINGEYMGTYTAMDYVEADRENGTSKRVDADEKTGWLIEMMNESGVDTSGDVYVAGTNYTRPWVVVKNPEPSYDEATDIETAIAAVTSPVQTFINNLWNSPETYVDKTTLVNWYIASEILGGTTTLSSVYAYKDAEDTQLKFGPLWGSELAWQSSAMTDLNDDGTKLGLVVNSSEESALRNLLQSLWSKSWFKNAVLAKWYQVRAGLKDNLWSNVEDAQLWITQSWTKNYAAKSDGGAGWTHTNELEDNVNAIKQYIVDRIAYLDKKFGLMTPDIEYDVTLADAMTEYSVYNGLPVNVTLKNRGTITSAYFNPITFPFSLTDAKLKEVFGSEYDLESFASITTESDNTKLIKLNFSRVNAADAGVPYIIKPETDVTNLTFNGVTFDVSEAKSVEQADHYFRGLLKPQSFVPDQTHLFVGKNNKFIRLNSNATLSGARAYFEIPAASYSKQFILGDFDDITGVENIIINTDSENNQKVYNLSGQLVGTSLKDLPKGVYVVNGKKIVR